MHTERRADEAETRFYMKSIELERTELKLRQKERQVELLRKYESKIKMHNDSRSIIFNATKFATDDSSRLDDVFKHQYFRVKSCVICEDKVSLMQIVCADWFLYLLSNQRLSCPTCREDMSVKDVILELDNDFLFQVQ